MLLTDEKTISSDRQQIAEEERTLHALQHELAVARVKLRAAEKAGQSLSLADQEVKKDTHYLSTDLQDLRRTEQRERTDSQLSQHS